MKDIHDLINELGARLKEEERTDARLLLNQLYLNGYSDLWICIALIKIIVRQDYFNNRYLFTYEPFISEVNLLESKFNKISNLSKDMQLSFLYGSYDDITTDTDRAQLDEYNELFNEYDNEEEINSYMNYLYLKYCFSYSEILNCNIDKYKFLLHGTNEPGFRDFGSYDF